jgi:hypothetical protein
VLREVGGGYAPLLVVVLLGSVVSAALAVAIGREAS